MRVRTLSPFTTTNTMTKAFLWLLISLCMSTINAQMTERDSLKLLLQNEKTDTGRVMRLADLSFAYLESKPDTTMQLALEALNLARQIGFEKGEAESLNRIGNVYRVWGNHSKALEVFLQALKINEKINNLDGIQRNYTNIGVIYNFQEDFQQALNYSFKALKLATQINNKKSASTILRNIGENYFQLKRFDSAILYVQQAYNAASSIKYSRMMGSSSKTLGQIHAEKGQNSLALDYYRLSIPDLINANSDLILSDTFLGMAKLFEKNGQKDSALFYGRKSLEFSSQKGFLTEVRDAGRFLSLFYRNLHIPDSAFLYQDITKAANDSLFSHQKNNQIQELFFNEKIRQADIAAAEIKAHKKRAHNLQYAAIALGLLTFLILFLILSHSIVANQKLIRFLGVIALLLVFEFINLFIHPYLSRITDDSPLIMLLVMVCIAALLVPLHHQLEKWISHRLVEKNKKIRLAAAKRTISKLEGHQTY